ncbi:hypothetical protein FS837_002659 [Tulasnella sp. UAMH 9824]|nr:hypothetical protein FS837_002659 [Tulasnella sp. UAMH 9824]
MSPVLRRRNLPPRSRFQFSSTAEKGPEVGAAEVKTDEEQVQELREGNRYVLKEGGRARLVAGLSLDVNPDEQCPETALQVQPRGCNGIFKSLFARVLAVPIEKFVDLPFTGVNKSGKPASAFDYQHMAGA